MPNSYEIEIVDFNTIDGGLEVFARAWKNGVQLGFGADGTIDIERFRIFNPPVLVEDMLGDIIIPEYTDVNTGAVIPERRLLEDPVEAIKQSLIQTISLVGRSGENIIVGKIGNTTSTFYTNGGDGAVGRVNQASWIDARDTADGTTAQTIESILIRSEDESASANDFACDRGFFPFDTSAISDTDTVDSATFSFYSPTAGTGNRSVGVVESTHKSASTLVVGDFDALTVNSATEGATRQTVGATSIYYDFALNATGVGWISKTGFTGLAVRLAFDLDNTTPAFGTDGRNYFYLNSSAFAGTTQDPKLVVVHSGATNSGFFAFM